MKDKDATMKTKLKFSQTVFLATMLFGMFFGAGNLIFPALMGQEAGWNLLPATVGFLITGVGLPLLSVAAIGITRSDGLQELSSKVGRGYSVFFTCALYLTIGPFFAIPRCATTSFTIGVEPMLSGEREGFDWILMLFSLVFFAIVLAFSLWPGKILIWVGKILTPMFLVFLGILVIAALVSPMASVKDIEPVADYATKSSSFFTGFLEGYNTMDVLAGLAFGIVVVNVIRGLGVKDPGDVAAHTVRSGVFSCLIMAVIYFAVALVGVQSRGVFEVQANGGHVLSLIAQHYFGEAGLWIMAGMVTLACLKTSVGLITSISETFQKMFPKALSYRAWAIVFSVVSFLIANLGLNAIIDYSVPVLMFLYPLSITLVVLALCGKWFRHARCVYVWVTGFTLVAAIFDLIKALPAGLLTRLHLQSVPEAVEDILPLYSLGLGWVCPAAAGLVIGLLHYFITRKRRQSSGVASAEQ